MQVGAAEARWSAATTELNRQRDSFKQATLEADQLKAAHDRLREDFATSNATKDQLRASLKVRADPVLLLLKNVAGSCQRVHPE